MIPGDFINSAFELGLGIGNWASVLKLHNDKQVRGVYIPTAALCTVWGFWNLYFYPAFGFILSFLAGISVVSANCIWLFLAWKYRKGAK